MHNGAQQRTVPPQRDITMSWGTTCSLVLRHATLACVAAWACCPAPPVELYRDPRLGDLLRCVATERGVGCASRFSVVDVSGRVAIVAVDGPHLQLLLDDGAWPALSGRLI